jgi:hypothetical protein
VSCRCKCCGRRLWPRPQNPHQQYCRLKECQNERRRLWRKERLRSDPDYRGNQADSQKRWLEKRPDYWRQYREAHPEYVAQNRRLQKERDGLKRELRAVAESGALLAKSDACPEKSETIPVYYELLPARAENLAKRYASRHIFQLIPVAYNDFLAKRPSCKEITRETLPGQSVTSNLCPRPSP